MHRMEEHPLLSVQMESNASMDVSEPPCVQRLHACKLMHRMLIPIQSCKLESPYKVGLYTLERLCD